MIGWRYTWKSRNSRKRRCLLLLRTRRSVDWLKCIARLTLAGIYIISYFLLILTATSHYYYNILLILLQKCNLDNPQLSSFGSEVELTEVRNMVQQLLRWAYKHNKNLEEQAAQLHMLSGWSQIVEVNHPFHAIYTLRLLIL